MTDPLWGYRLVFAWSARGKPANAAMPNKPFKCARRLTVCIACPQVCIFLAA